MLVSKGAGHRTEDLVTRGQFHLLLELSPNCWINTLRNDQGRESQKQPHLTVMAVCVYVCVCKHKELQKLTTGFKY